MSDFRQREEPLTLLDGKPDINSFNALILKIRIIDWHILLNLK